MFAKSLGSAVFDVADYFVAVGGNTRQKMIVLVEDVRDLKIWPIHFLPPFSVLGKRASSGL
jgi:hypothetical protein